MIILRMAIIRMVIVFGTIIAGAGAAIAAPYADIVIDARTGKVLHESSPDRKLHPASLTKMMTLYLTFEAVTSGQLSLDRKVKISRHAAAQPASKIGLRAGQRVKVRDLIRAAAVKSANDAATALAEAIGGSERRFGDMMTAKARKLGMMNSRFLNANGLTQKGHYSTARDMALLGRALFYDYPQYYNLFGRTQTRAMGRTIRNTNRRLLANYRGADGIKTGFTNAAGFNLVSSAERGGQRVIAVVFGGRSSASRNARIAELLDLGFRKAPRGGKAVPTSVMAARNGAKPAKSRVVAAVKTSPKPMPRPEEEESPSVRCWRRRGMPLSRRRRPRKIRSATRSFPRVRARCHGFVLIRGRRPGRWKSPLLPPRRARLRRLVRRLMPVKLTGPCNLVFSLIRRMPLPSLPPPRWAMSAGWSGQGVRWMPSPFPGARPIAQG